MMKLQKISGEKHLFGLLKQLCSIGLGLLGFASSVQADGIYMTNMQTQLTPASVTLLTDLARTPGGQAGDIIEFVLSGNVAAASGTETGGPGVYFTAYPAPGLTVLGASFVTSAAGTTNRAPGQGGRANNGWGARGSQTTLAPPSTSGLFGFPFATYLNGRQNDVYGDTGIFYSVNARTKLTTDDANFPGFVNITKGPTGNPKTASTSTTNNGINVVDTFFGNVDAFNYWDADQVNAFGSLGTPGLVPTTRGAIPTSNATVINSKGVGVPPLGAGSAVAGPQTGYTMDNTGNVGPWNRIQYPGSSIADISDGAAIAAGTLDFPTVLDASASGVSLSDASPLSVSTNAVRWADGYHAVGDQVFVKIRVQLGTVMSASDGIIANFDATASDNHGSGSKDNPWRYFAATVSHSATLYVLKEILKVNGVTYTGGTILPGSTITYRIRYLNIGNLPVTAAALTDTLPGGIATVGCTVSTPTLSNPSAGVTFASVSAGTTSCPASAATLTFGSLPNVVSGKIGALRGGSFTFDVKLSSTLTNSTVVSNTATFAGTSMVSGAATSALSVASVTIFVPPPTDMAVSYTVPASAPMGTVVNGTVNFTNTTANPAINPTVTLQLSPGLVGVSVDGGALGVGAYDSVTGIVTFPTAQTTLAGNAVLKAVISYIQPNSSVSVSATTTAANDNNSANNSLATSVAPLVSDMTVLYQLPTGAPVGTTVNGTVNFVNIGASAAVNPTVTLQLSAGLSGVTVNSSLLGVGVYDSVTGIVTFPSAPASLAVNATISAVITYTQPATTVTVAATTTATNDTNAANNSPTASSVAPITILPPNLAASLTKTVVDDNGGTLDPGNTMTYTIAFSNTGEDTATLVVITDPIPTSTTFVAGSLKVLGVTMSDTAGNDLAEFLTGPNRVVFRVGMGASGTAGGSLGPGQGTTVTFQVTVDASAAGRAITNTATVSSKAQTLLTTYSNPTSVVIKVKSFEPTFDDLKKTVVDDNGGTLDPGNTMTYTISFSNSGVDSAKLVTVSDVIPASTTFVAGSMKILGVPKTDTQSDDTAEYDSVLNRVVFRVGTGAGNLVGQGGSLGPGLGMTVSFQVTVNANAAGKVISNTVNVGFSGQTSGTAYNASASVLITVKSPAVPALRHQKTVQVISDPMNGTTNPKNIPGAVSQYTLTVNNTGDGPVDAGTLAVVDPIPNNSELFTGNLSGGAPYIFTDAPLSSGLTCPFVALGSAIDCVDFSKDGGSTWLYTPATPFDPLVTHIRFKMTGAMNADGIVGAPYPSFTLQFQTRVK
jgi:uncharacterized repeat protein (TIGR01451 family)